MDQLRQPAAAALLPGSGTTRVQVSAAEIPDAGPGTVEFGVPGAGLGAAARIDTYGGSMVCLRAAAELIAATIANTRKATRHA